MNIHHAGGAHVPTPRGHRASSAGTQPPRTREGKTYPGGRELRRRRTKLHARIHGSVDKTVMEWDSQKGYTKPGSLSS